MISPDNPQIEENEDILDELSEYFSVLGNETRLKILKIIEKEPKDTRMIARTLHDKWKIEVAIPNTKRHLKMLIDIGVVTKYPVIREDGQIVMFYKHVAGSLDTVLNNLRVLKEYRSKADTIGINNVVEEDIDKILIEFPLTTKLVLLDDKEIAQEFQIDKKSMSIGRLNPDENDISLPDTDRTVGRNQSRISCESGKYYIEDTNSKNGTYILDSNQQNFAKIEPGKRVELNDGDVIRLGLLSTILVFRKARN